MELSKLNKIFDETESEWEGDNAFKGLLILSKYTDYVLHAAEHDEIYSCDVADVIDKITEEDAIALAKLNWMIDSQHDCFTCFV
jgi:hypothetical protein